MTAYRDAFHVDAGSPVGRLQRAAQVLAEGNGIVVLDGRLALRPTSRLLLCEVIDSASAVHRCDHEYEVMVENARRALEASPLFAMLPGMPRKWVVVADHGTGTVEQWRAP
jgi:hypothetical protein